MIQTGRFFEIHRRKKLRISLLDLKWLFSYAEAYCVVAYVIADIILSNSYTMDCPPVRGDNPRALASDYLTYKWTNMV